MKKRNLKVVILTGPGFEDAEVIYPYYRLQEEGLIVEVATSSDGDVIGKHGNPFSPTLKLQDLQESDFAAAIIPGGYEAPDRLRQKVEILNFLWDMNKKQRLISSTCHGPWVLISAKLLKGKKATCYIGMKDDLVNSGAIYMESPVVVDGNIITSDHPRNLGPWMKETLETIKGTHK